MKIACICNMNNMMFTLSRFLIDRGYDVHLFELKDEPFSLSSDSYDNKYESYSTKLQFNRDSFFDSDDADLQLLHGFDFYIGTDIAPAILAKIGISLDLFIPHGSDIYSYPFFTTRDHSVNKVWWMKSRKYIAEIQHLGIEACNTILFPDEYDIHFPYKDKLRFSGKYLNTSIPMVYHPQYEANVNQEAKIKLPHFNFFKEIRDTSDFMIFSHTRQNGVIKNEALKVHEKGNDKLIRGFNEFVKSNQAKNPKLILFEYGMDIEFSKNLVEELELQNHIVWAKKMDRKEIMMGIMMSDLGAGEFQNSWLTCGVVNEIISAKKPLLHFRDDKLYQDEYPELYPLLNAFSTEEISNQLTSAYSNLSELQNQSRKALIWLEEFSVKTPIELVTSLIEESKKKSVNSQLIRQSKKISRRINSKVMRSRLKAKLFG